MIDEKCSLALHLGTYAAAIENMLRRMADQDSPNCRYWLHQVEVCLQPGDLAPGVRSELSGWFGDVHITELAKLRARAVRYVNTQEAVGSISLAIDPGVITRVRTIALPLVATALPASATAERAVTHAVAELAEAEQLRPDTTGLSEDEIFDSEWRASLDAARRQGDADNRVVEVARQMNRYRDRQREIGSTLEGALVDAYLVDVNTQVRDRFTRVMPPDADPVEYHQRFREMASVLALPLEVVRQFDGASWRTLEKLRWPGSGHSPGNAGCNAECGRWGVSG
jgi:hypothetical protein